MAYSFSDATGGVYTINYADFSTKDSELPVPGRQ